MKFTLVLVLALLLAACSKDSDNAGGSVTPPLDVPPVDQPKGELAKTSLVGATSVTLTIQKPEPLVEVFIGAPYNPREKEKYVYVQYYIQFGRVLAGSMGLTPGMPFCSLTNREFMNPFDLIYPKYIPGDRFVFTKVKAYEDGSLSLWTADDKVHVSCLAVKENPSPMTVERLNEIFNTTAEFGAEWQGSSLPAPTVERENIPLEYATSIRLLVQNTEVLQTVFISANSILTMHFIQNGEVRVTRERLDADKPRCMLGDKNYINANDKNRPKYAPGDVLTYTRVFGHGDGSLGVGSVDDRLWLRCNPADGSSEPLTLKALNAMFNGIAEFDAEWPTAN